MDILFRLLGQCRRPPTCCVFPIASRVASRYGHGGGARRLAEGVREGARCGPRGLLAVGALRARAAQACTGLSQASTGSCCLVALPGKTEAPRPPEPSCAPWAAVAARGWSTHVQMKNESPVPVLGASVPPRCPSLVASHRADPPAPTRAGRAGRRRPGRRPRGRGLADSGPDGAKPALGILATRHPGADRGVRQGAASPVACCCSPMCRPPLGACFSHLEARCCTPAMYLWPSDPRDSYHSRKLGPRCRAVIPLAMRLGLPFGWCPVLRAGGSAGSGPRVQAQAERQQAASAGETASAERTARSTLSLSHARTRGVERARRPAL